MSLYDVLGVRETAGLDEVRQAFQRRAFAAHPDTEGGSDAALQEVLQAFETLSGTHSRASYDQRLASATGVVLPQSGRTSKSSGFAAEEELPAEFLPVRSEVTGAANADEGRGRVARACRRAHRDGMAMLQSLSSLLKELPRDRRRDVLAHKFSQPQRLALERWMLEQKRASDAAGSRPCQDGPCATPTPAKRRSQQELGGPLRKRKRSSCDQDTGGLQQRRQQQPCPSKSPVADASRMMGTQAARAQGVVRIVRGPWRRRYYFACVAVSGGLRLLSRCDPDLRVALHFHVVLTAIKQRIAEGCATGETALETRFTEAVRSTLEEFSLSAKDVRGLRFLVSLRALWTGSALRTRAFCLNSELDMGLRAWRRLSDARGHVAPHRSNVLRSCSPQDVDDDWMRLRHEYFRVMVEAGCPSDRVLSRLNVMEKQHQACKEKQAERWNQSRMAEEERLQRLGHKYAQGKQMPNARRTRDLIPVAQSFSKSCSAQAEIAIQLLLKRWKRCHGLRTPWNKRCTRSKDSAQKRRIVSALW